MKKIISLALLLPFFGFAQKTHLFSFSGSYGISFIQSKSFNRFVEGFNTYNSNIIVDPLKKISVGKTFDFTVNFPLKQAGVHLGYSHTTASTSVAYTNNRGRTFDFTRKGFHLGFDANTENAGADNKFWMTFSPGLFYGWQDITTAYQYYPGLDYHGAQQKDLNGQYYIAALLFQTEISASYKIKGISFFIKGGVHFPNLLNQHFHNLERAQLYNNMSFLPTNLTDYYADPSDYAFRAIDDSDMYVSARNWMYTFSVGLSFHFVEGARSDD